MKINPGLYGGTILKTNSPPFTGWVNCALINLPELLLYKKIRKSLSPD